MNLIDNKYQSNLNNYYNNYKFKHNNSKKTFTFKQAIQLEYYGNYSHGPNYDGYRTESNEYYTASEDFGKDTQIIGVRRTIKIRKINTTVTFREPRDILDEYEEIKGI